MIGMMHGGLYIGVVEGVEPIIGVSFWPAGVPRLLRSFTSLCFDHHGAAMTLEPVCWCTTESFAVTKALHGKSVTRLGFDCGAMRRRRPSKQQSSEEQIVIDDQGACSFQD